MIILYKGNISHNLETVGKNANQLKECISIYRVQFDSHFTKKNEVLSIYVTNANTIIVKIIKFNKKLKTFKKAYENAFF
jgi:hypothetical protein